MASDARTPHIMPSIEARPGKTTSWSILTAIKGGGVTVEVGQTRKKYLLHRGIVCHHSEYFQKALSGSWKEAQDGVVILEDVETTTFNLFDYWLYMQQIPYDLLENEWEHILELEDNTTATTITQAHLTTCIKAYALGGRLVAPVFLQHVNDRFTQFYSQHQGYLAAERYPLVELAFNNIPLERIVLQFLVDHHCTHSWFWGPTEGEDNQVDMSALEDHLPHRFLLHTMKRQKELDTMTAGERFIYQCYREHASDGEKSNCKAKHMRYDALVDFGFFD